jgi:hypothetical protein
MNIKAKWYEKWKASHLETVALNIESRKEQDDGKKSSFNRRPQIKTILFSVSISVPAQFSIKGFT